MSPSMAGLVVSIEQDFVIPFGKLHQQLQSAYFEPSTIAADTSSAADSKDGKHSAATAPSDANIDLRRSSLLVLALLEGLQRVSSRAITAILRDQYIELSSSFCFHAGVQPLF